jgi:hypothetical protein
LLQAEKYKLVTLSYFSKLVIFTTFAKLSFYWSSFQMNVVTESRTKTKIFSMTQISGQLGLVSGTGFESPVQGDQSHML